LRNTGVKDKLYSSKTTSLQQLKEGLSEAAVAVNGDMHIGAQMATAELQTGLTVC
jgi:hypothetical protein